MMKYGCLLVLCLISLCAFWLQAHMLMHEDVINTIHVSSLLLENGAQHYGMDYLEFSPPMIMHLTFPALLFSKWLGIDIYTSFIAYTISLIMLSMTCCYVLLRKLQGRNYFILATATFVLLFLPANFFGQREHFLLILILPYLVSIAVRIENKPINAFFAIMIGIMAGLGFSLKPFFIPAFLCVELYLLLSKRHVLRLECIMILLTLILYHIYVFIFFHNYIFTLAPVVTQLYSASIREPWHIIFSHWYVLYCCAAILVYLLNQQKTIIGNVFFCALLGLMIAFLIPRASWFQHVLPAFGIACLLFASIFVSQLSRPLQQNILLILGLLLFYYPIYETVHLTQSAALKKQYFLRSPLLQFFQQQSVQTSFLCLSLQDMDFQYLIPHSRLHYVGITPNLWWLIGLTKLQMKNEQLNDMVANNIEKNKPTIILVDTTPPRDFLNIKIDMINELKQNAIFQHAWRAYHYQTTIGKFAIYRRELP